MSILVGPLVRATSSSDVTVWVELSHSSQVTLQLGVTAL